MVKSQRWCWPLLLSEGVISTILLLTQRPKELQDWVNGPYGQGATLVLGMKILKRLSTEEVYVQEIRRLRGPDLLTTLLARWVCESNVTCDFSHAWLSTHVMMCMGNLALSCGSSFSRPLTPPAYGDWPAPLIWRAVETVMRVMLRTQSYIDALVAGITTLTLLVQLHTPDLKDPADSSWARGTPGSRNPRLLEHPNGTLGSCPQAMASMMEGSLLGVETSLRRPVVLDEDEQKGELLQNMCVRLLDMLSPPGWLRIKDVPIRHHTWMYFPLGHLHTHFPAQITVRLIVRQDQGESNLGAPQLVELNVRVPLDSTFHEVIHRALADQSSGRLGSFRQQV